MVGLGLDDAIDVAGGDVKPLTGQQSLADAVLDLGLGDRVKGAIEDVDPVRPGVQGGQGVAELKPGVAPSGRLADWPAVPTALAPGLYRLGNSLEQRPERGSPLDRPASGQGQAQSAGGQGPGRGQAAPENKQPVEQLHEHPVVGFDPAAGVGEMANIDLGVVDDPPAQAQQGDGHLLLFPGVGQRLPEAADPPVILGPGGKAAAGKGESGKGFFPPPVLGAAVDPGAGVEPVQIPFQNPNPDHGQLRPAPEQGGQLGQMIRSAQQGVVVHDEQDLAGRLPGGHVARLAHPGVGDRFEPGLHAPPGQVGPGPVDHLQGVVGRSGVEDNHFQGPVILDRDRIEALSQDVGPVEIVNQNAEFHLALPEGDWFID